MPMVSRMVSEAAWMASIASAPDDLDRRVAVFGLPPGGLADGAGPADGAGLALRPPPHDVLGHHVLPRELHLDPGHAHGDRLPA